MFLSTTKGRSPVPWYRHSGTQPRILACWCSPPPLAPPPHELSARATRATNTPVANSALSLLMTILLTPLHSLGDVEVRYSRLHHWLPTPLGATFCGTRFCASACSWEAAYQDCEVWHIPQTSYLCYCLALLARSELLRTPLRRSSQNSYSTHFGE